MPEITYWVCDCCGAEDHYPTMPDGTPTKKGLGVACTAVWYSRLVDVKPPTKRGKTTRATQWLVRMLLSAGRGDDAARKHGTDGIYLCKACSGPAEIAAGEAALKVLLARGLKPYKPKR